MALVTVHVRYYCTVTLVAVRVVFDDFYYCTDGFATVNGSCHCTSDVRCHVITYQALLNSSCHLYSRFLACLSYRIAWRWEGFVA